MNSISKKAKVQVTVTPSSRTVIVSPQNQPQKKQKNKKKKNKGPKNYCPEWFNLVSDPFGHEPCAIPDEDTRPSFKFSSEYNTELNTAVTGGGTSTTPSIMISFMPTATVQGAGTNDGVIGFHYPDTSSDPIFDFTGATAGPSLITLTEVPNASAMLPALTDGGAYSTPAHRLRCTGLGVTITPLSPELYRSGSISAGLLQPPDNLASAIAAIFNPANVAFGGDAAVPWTSVRSRLQHLTQARQPDGSFEYHWVPQKIPKYHSKVLVADLPTTTEFLQTQPNFPVIYVRDNLAVAAISGSLFHLRVVWHWEVSSSAYIQMVGKPTPSPYSVRDIEYCINNFPQLHSALVDTGMGPHRVAGERDVATHSTRSVLEPLGNIAREALGTVTSDVGFQSRVAQVAAGAALGALGLSRARLGPGR